jgi:hypothetical protein
MKRLEEIHGLVHDFFCRTDTEIVTKKTVFILCTVIYLYPKFNIKSTCNRSSFILQCNRGVAIAIEHGQGLGTLGVGFTNFYSI